MRSNLIGGYYRAANFRDLRMHNIQIAEWILRLATSNDRAESTMGDLVEGAATRGVIWFWSSVLRTAASLIWRGLAECPLRMAGVACAGLAVDVLAAVLIAFLSGSAFFIAAMSAGGHRFDIHSLWWTIGLDAPPLIASWIIGRALARWAPGRELAACLAYAIAGSIFSLILDIVCPGGLGLSALLGVFLVDVAQRTPVLAGALWGRHRRLAAR
jgi:hypothetical protein